VRATYRVQLYKLVVREGRGGGVCDGEHVVGNFSFIPKSTSVLLRLGSLKSLICETSAGTEEDLVARIVQKCDAVQNATEIFRVGATECSVSLQCPQ